jgi:hypothetical protein
MQIKDMKEPTFYLNVILLESSKVGFIFFFTHIYRINTCIIMLNTSTNSII